MYFIRGAKYILAGAFLAAIAALAASCAIPAFRGSFIPIGVPLIVSFALFSLLIHSYISLIKFENAFLAYAPFGIKLWDKYAFAGTIEIHNQSEAELSCWFIMNLSIGDKSFEIPAVLNGNKAISLGPDAIFTGRLEMKPNSAEHKRALVEIRERTSNSKSKMASRVDLDFRYKAKLRDEIFLAPIASIAL